MSLKIGKIKIAKSDDNINVLDVNAETVTINGQKIIATTGDMTVTIDSIEIGGCDTLEISGESESGGHITVRR